MSMEEIAKMLDMGITADELAKTFPGWDPFAVALYFDYVRI